MSTPKRSHHEKNKIIPVCFDASFFFERGIRSLRRQELNKALKFFQRCVDLEAENMQYVTHLAAVYTEIGNFEESNRLLGDVLRTNDPSLAECYYYMANNYAHLGDFDEAEQYALLYCQAEPNGIYLEDAEELLDFICYELDRDPRILDGEHQLISQHERARCALETGKFLEAAALLEEMVEEYPTFLAARNNLALTYYYLGRFADAMHVITEILEKDQANLHALCNLAVFYAHKGKDKEVRELVEGLKKICPVHMDHHYKLAITLGILGEDERAYELLKILLKRGLGQEDITLYHYVAVASFNTGRLQLAKSYWQKLKELDTEEIATYYLHKLEQNKLISKQERLPYHYQLPYEVQLKQKEWFGKGKLSGDILNDPLIRSSLFWSLKHGDSETKIQVIQTLELLADPEAEEVLRQLVQDIYEEEGIKKVALLALRKIDKKKEERYDEAKQGKHEI